MSPVQRSTLQRLLAHAAAGAGFLAAALIGPKDAVVGMYVAPGLDRTTTEAPLLTARRIFGNPESRAQLAHLHESVFYDLDGRRLVCRPLALETPGKGELHLLIVLIPAGQAYRRALNRLVKTLQGGARAS